MRQYKIQINKNIIDNMKKGLKHFRENEKLENLYNIIYNHEPLAINLHTANAKAVRIVAIYVVYQSICLGNYRLRCRYGDSNVYII